MLFDWPVFTAYDKIEAVDYRVDTSRVGEFYVKFYNGEGPKTHDGHVSFTSDWYSNQAVYYFKNKTDSTFVYNTCSVRKQKRTM